MYAKLHCLTGCLLLGCGVWWIVGSAFALALFVPTAAAVRRNWRCNIKSHVFNWYVYRGKPSLCGLLGQNTGSEKTPWLVLVRVLFTSQNATPSFLDAAIQEDRQDTDIDGNFRGFLNPGVSSQRVIELLDVGSWEQDRVKRCTNCHDLGVWVTSWSQVLMASSLEQATFERLEFDTWFVPLSSNL